MNIYAVALREQGDGGTALDWIEFYHADDPEHAREQAQDANGRAKVLAVAVDPYADAAWTSPSHG
jgi:hypothetical protein